MEQMVFRVKLLMENHGAADQCELGNLKNRNIDGSELPEILSQSESEEGGGADDEEYEEDE
jgi:hypothetical protein